MKNTTIDINESTVKNYVESLRPEDLEIRTKLDFGYSYDKKVVIIYKIRPVWNNPKKLRILSMSKSDFINQNKSGFYTGSEQVENGKFILLLKVQRI